MRVFDYRVPKALIFKLQKIFVCHCLPLCKYNEGFDTCKLHKRPKLFHCFIDYKKRKEERLLRSIEYEIDFI